MKKWLKRIPGAVGLGLIWAGAWVGVLAIVTVGVDTVEGFAWTPSLEDLLSGFVLFVAVGFLAFVLGAGSAALGRGRRENDGD